MEAVQLKGLIAKKHKVQQAVYYEHSDRLMRTILRYVPSVTDAEEVVQDTFIRVFERIKDYDPKRGTFEAWSSKIAINFALMKVRKIKQLQFYEKDLSHYSPYLQVLAGIPNEADSRIAYEELQQRINEMDEKYAIIIKLRAVEGYSHQEIGELLGIKPTASRTLFSRARKKLKEMMYQSYYGMLPSTSNKSII